LKLIFDLNFILKTFIITFVPILTNNILNSKNMKLKSIFVYSLALTLGLSSCVSKKKFKALSAENEQNLKKYSQCDVELAKLKSSLDLRVEQIEDLKKQVEDYKSLRDKQLTQVGDLTVLSQQANKNIDATLAQLEKKDKYIQMLQAAKTKADSINLALAVNLKSALKDGLDDKDIEVNIDKTVVFINLSDKMLYKSGSSELTPRANEVLKKIAQIIDSRKDLEVMVESHTDNNPIKNGCLQDNWDLSVKRSTSVVRALEKNHKINPGRLIASGRGEHAPVASNNTNEGRAMNRRTRIIIMPKLDQFYDLLSPTNVPK
jgi:chemotaxis protein MotB